MLLDLTQKEHSYLFGFLQGDGHLYLNRRKPNKGRVSVEINAADKSLLLKFQSMFPFYSSVRERSRDTNFKKEYTAAIWNVSGKEFRDELIALGLIPGKKSVAMQPPLVAYAQSDYFRGWMDADGSLGISGSGLPFVSLTTASEAIATAYMDFLFEITGKQKHQCRNQRDNIFNVMVWKEDAQQVARTLYYDGCLALPRKLAKAQDMEVWIRPASMKFAPNRQDWTPEQDEIVLTVTAAEAMQLLGRSQNSVIIRRSRLRRASKRQLVTD